MRGVQVRVSILRRRESDRFSEVVREWEAVTAVVLGAGPSLMQDQVALVRRARDADVRCIAVNDTYLWAPWADVCYFADSQFWEWHTAGIDKPLLRMRASEVRESFAEFPGQKCSIENSGANIKDDAVHILRNKRSPNNAQGLSLEPGVLATAHGKNSGFQALNIAALAGAKKIILLGFDGRPAADGREHFHGGHPRPTPAHFYEAMRKGFSAAENEIKAAGVRVINCSPGSAIDSFPKMKIEEALA